MPAWSAQRGHALLVLSERPRTELLALAGAMAASAHAVLVLRSPAGKQARALMDDLLDAAVPFARAQAAMGHVTLVACEDGVDLAGAVALALLVAVTLTNATGREGSIRRRFEGDTCGSPRTRRTRSPLPSCSYRRQRRAWVICLLACLFACLLAGWFLRAR